MHHIAVITDTLARKQDNSLYLLADFMLYGAIPSYFCFFSFPFSFLFYSLFIFFVWSITLVVSICHASCFSALDSACLHA